MDTLINTFREIRKLYSSGEYQEILNIIAEFERCCDLPVTLLLYKSASIELSNDVHQDSVNKAKDCLLNALSQEPNNVVVLTELGWFYFNVLDDAKSALSYFQNALRISDTQKQEINEAVQKCLDDIADIS